MTSLCFLCPRPGCLCQYCGCVPHCPLHASFHRDKTDTYCFPFTTETREGRGRCVTATRDISPLELVMEDRPVGLAPVQDSLPVCLQCFRRMAPGGFCCAGCNMPMCGEVCQGGDRHREECQIFQVVIEISTCSDIRFASKFRIRAASVSNAVLTT